MWFAKQVINQLIASKDPADTSVDQFVSSQPTTCQVDL